MRRPLAREPEVVRTHVHADDPRAGPLCEVERQLALARADVEDTIAGLDALDEEVVIRGQPVLRVDAAVVADRRAVDLALEVVVEREELAQRVVGLTPFREDVHPRLEDAVADPRRHPAERGPPHPPDQPATSRSKTSRWRSTHGFASKRSDRSRAAAA